MAIRYGKDYGTWKTAKARSYHRAVDFKLLEAMGVDVVMLLPWQIQLSMEGLVGKFLWYPSAGTLVYDNNEAGGGFTRVAQKGDFKAGGDDKYLYVDYATELVYERMQQQFALENEEGVGVIITSSEE